MNMCSFLLIFSLVVESAALKIAVGDTMEVQEEVGHGAGTGSGVTEFPTLTPTEAVALATACTTAFAGIGTTNSVSSAVSGTTTAKVSGQKINMAAPPAPAAKVTATTKPTGAVATAKQTATVTVTGATLTAIATRLSVCGGGTVPPILTVTAPSLTRPGIDAVDFGFVVCPPTGACTECTITTAQMGTGFVEVTLPCATRGCTECKWITPGGALSTAGVTTVPGAPTGFLTCRYSHTSTGTTGNPAPAGTAGDPKATNLQGQKFEILQLGTFSLLSISGYDEEGAQGAPANRLSLDATIDRAGEMCGATYIKNVSITGSWLQEQNLANVRVRAAPEVLKSKALQVAFHDEWQQSKDAKMTSQLIDKATDSTINFRVHTVSIEIQIDSHRIREDGRKTNKFANFLNVNVNGLEAAKEENVYLGGLLAYDDHSFASTTPDACKQGKVFNLKQKMGDEKDDLSFLSNIRVN